MLKLLPFRFSHFGSLFFGEVRDRRNARLSIRVFRNWLKVWYERSVVQIREGWVFISRGTSD